MDEALIHGTPWGPVFHSELVKPTDVNRQHLFAVPTKLDKSVLDEPLETFTGYVWHATIGKQPELYVDRFISDLLAARYPDSKIVGHEFPTARQKFLTDITLLFSSAEDAMMFKLANEAAQ